MPDPFGWYAAGDLPGLDMFDDARLLALTLLDGLAASPDDGAPGAEPGLALGAALLARLGNS